MGITNKESGTRIDEIAEDIFRISTPVPPSVVPGGFSFNQYLIRSASPLLFHSGSLSLFPLVREAVEAVMPVSKLKYIGFSHYEQDECGSLNEFLAVAPNAVPLCGQINAMINRDGFLRAPRTLADGETLSIGKHLLRWFDTPHLPHGWECGYLMEESTRTLLCGDLFTQGGSDNPVLTESDILMPSEDFRKQMDYFAHAKNTRNLFEKLAAASPQNLACMHGSAWHGNGSGLLMDLANLVERS